MVTQQKDSSALVAETAQETASSSTEERAQTSPRQQAPHPPEIKNEGRHHESALLQKWIYLEQETPFSLMGKSVQADADTKIIRLKGISRALGVLQAEFIEMDETGKRGKLAIGEHLLSFNDLRSSRDGNHRPLAQYLHQPVSFSFWPALRYRHDFSRGPFRYEPLRVSGLSLEKGRPDNYCEVVGRLEKLWEDGFEIKLWSTFKRELMYIYFHGPYPFPDERGEMVWVKGYYDLKERTLRATDTKTLTFVPDEVLLRIFNKPSEENPQRQRKKKSKNTKK